MRDESIREASGHLIILRRAGDSGDPDFNLWHAELPTLAPGKVVGRSNISDAVDDARKAAVTGKDYELELKVKVAEGTSLDAQDVLALIQANGGPAGLDLSGCFMGQIELSRDVIRQARNCNRTVSEPVWSSLATGGACLVEVQFRDARLIEAQLQGADLMGAQLERASLWGAQLQHARLRSAHLVGVALTEAQLQEADFRDAELQGVDLYRCASLAGAHWYGAYLDRTRMRRHQLGSGIGDETRAHGKKTSLAYLQAAEAYLLLKNNFLTLARSGDVGWAYMKEQQMEKMAYHWAWRQYGARLLRRYEDYRPHDWAGVRVWKFAVLWLRNWAYELLTGYGERPFLPVLWGIVVILAFAGGYAVAGNIAPDFAGDPATAHGSHNFIDALTHSIGAFATIGFNTLEPLGWGARILTAIESALGIGLFALFIFTLGNRMSRS